jgi:hypothetical protein
MDREISAIGEALCSRGYFHNRCCTSIGDEVSGFLLGIPEIGS